MADARKEYADIIDRERPVSEKHPPMPRLNRAAQFSPFAALTGYDDLIRESERETDAQTELDESAKEELNRKLLWLLQRGAGAEAAFTVFVPDGKKSGGRYVTRRGAIARYDAISGLLRLSGGGTVPIEDIRAIEIEDLPEGP